MTARTESVENKQIISNAEFKRIYWLGRGEAINHFKGDIRRMTAESLSREELLEWVERSSTKLACDPVLRNINETSDLIKS